MIESSIDAATGSHSNLSTQLGALANHSGVAISTTVLKTQINRDFNQSGFDQTLKILLDGQYALDNGSKVGGMAADIAVAYGIRNHAAHNVSGSPIIWERYAHIRQSLFNVLFLTVETLY